MFFILWWAQENFKHLRKKEKCTNLVAIVVKKQQKLQIIQTGTRFVFVIINAYKALF